jgi:NTE family protein
MLADIRLLPAVLAVALLAGCTLPGEKPVPPAPVPVAVPVKIGLALGGGAARGFAHIGVIKVLEAQGIVPDIIVGTSAGAVVGALYANGLNGFELQRAALDMDKDNVFDWNVSLRGPLKGEPLRRFVNDAVLNRPLDKLKRGFAAATRGGRCKPRLPCPAYSSRLRSTDANMSTAG